MEDSIDDFSIKAKLIFFIYSLESFIAYNLNKAEKLHNITKILTFGPYSSALKELSKYA